jgi:hypothetical protein
MLRKLSTTKHTKSTKPYLFPPPRIAGRMKEGDFVSFVIFVVRMPFQCCFHDEYR